MKNPNEVITIVKIREGFFIGDKSAGTNLEILKEYKITHIINSTNDKNLNKYEEEKIQYFNLNWSEDPLQQLFELNDENIKKIMKFIDSSYKCGEGILTFSIKCQNRACIVAIIYLIKIYNWSVHKCIQYLQSKKINVSIPNFFLKQLNDYEYKNNLHSKIKKSINWNEENNKKDKEELIMRNTYLNSNFGKNEKRNYVKEIDIMKNINGNKIVKFKDNYLNGELVSINIEQDLYLKKDIKDIENHILMKPKKSCIKIDKKVNLNDLKNDNFLVIFKKKNESKINENNNLESLNNSKNKIKKNNFLKIALIKNNNFNFIYPKKVSSILKLPVKLSSSLEKNHYKNFIKDLSLRTKNLSNNSINLINQSNSLKFPFFSPTNESSIKMNPNSFKKIISSKNKENLFYKPNGSKSKPIKLNNHNIKILSSDNKKQKEILLKNKNNRIKRPLTSTRERENNIILIDNKSQKKMKRTPSPMLRQVNLRYYYNNDSQNNYNNSSFPNTFLSLSIENFNKRKN